MRTCLVIDDWSVIRKVASRILARFGVSVDEAAGGAEGLAKIEAALPQVVLVSGSLSDMPADELVRRIRALPGGTDITVLGMLVEANLGLMTRLKRAGTNGFIYKPFDRVSLTEWLDPYFRFKEAA